MPTHSLDLRQRVVAAYQAGNTSIRQVPPIPVAVDFVDISTQALGNDAG
jgi:hypothetical protein